MNGRRILHPALNVTDQPKHASGASGQPISAHHKQTRLALQNQTSPPSPTRPPPSSSSPLQATTSRSVSQGTGCTCQRRAVENLQSEVVLHTRQRAKRVSESSSGQASSTRCNRQRQKKDKSKSECTTSRKRAHTDSRLRVG